MKEQWGREIPSVISGGKWFSYEDGGNGLSHVHDVVYLTWLDMHIEVWVG